MLVLFLGLCRWLRLSRVRALNDPIALHRPPGDSRAVEDTIGNDHFRFVVNETDVFPFSGDFREDLVNNGHSSHCYSDRARRQGPVRTSLVKSAKNISIGLLLASTLAAQVIYQATAPTSQTFNNINPRDNAFTVMYNYSGSGTFSIELDCAADATVAGGTPTPGSFSACTPTTGTNPSTTPNFGYITFIGYKPWIKLNLKAISSGNMTALTTGFAPADPEGGGSGGCAGTSTTPCIVAGPNTPGTASTKNPVQVAGNDGTNVRAIATDTSGRSNVVGTAAIGSPESGNPVPIANVDGSNNIIVPTYCNLSAPVSLTTSGLTQLVALSIGLTVRICNISVSFASAVDFQLEYGTGSACGTGTTAITGVYKSILTIALDFNSGTLNGIASNALCANLGASVVGGGVVNYGLF